MRIRGWARIWALAATVLAVFAACEPAPPPPPPPPDVLVVYGDSLTVEAGDHLRERLVGLLPGWEVVIRAFGGTAQCDWHDDMTSDAEQLNVKGVVIAFYGNDLTQCITSRPYAAAYLDDANWAADFWQARSVKLAFVAGPGTVGSTVDQGVVANIYKQVGAARGATVVDASPLLRDVSGTYRGTMPCLVDECTGTIAVRAGDGVHFCPVPQPNGTACTVYSSGVVRFAEEIVHAVATMLGLAQPPYRSMTSP